MSRFAARGTVLFFALLAASLAAAVLVVQARTPDLELEVTDLTRDFRPPSSAQIEFFVRDFEPAARVEIVDADGDLVETLDDEVTLEPEQKVSYRWAGRTDDPRAIAPPGRYALRVSVDGGDRVMEWPRRIILLDPPSTAEPPPVHERER